MVVLICISLMISAYHLEAQTVNNPSAMQETQIRSLGQEDPLEEGMATHLVLLPGESPCTEAWQAYSTQGRKESDTTEATQHVQKALKS